MNRLAARGVATSLAVLIFAVLAVSADGQAKPAGAFAPLSRTNAPAPLQTLVTLSADSATLSDVISTITRQAGVSVVYDQSLPGLDKRVTLHATRVAASDALIRALDGTLVQAMVSPTGQVVIVSRPRASSSTHPLRGSVRESASGAPVGGARIELIGTRFATLSRDSGDFSFNVVPAGEYTVSVARIGFGRVTLERVVVSDAQNALNVVLDPVPTSLAGVVVTPGYFGLMQDGIAVQQTMTRQQIETVPQIGEDIFRAVNRLPGVTSSDFSSKFFVRGANGDELYTTLDGLELVEPFHLKDLGGALSIIDARAIGGVELITGGFTAEHGDRLTGVFNMRSLDPRVAGGGTSLGLSITNARVTSHGTFDQARGGWLASARRGYLELALKLSNFSDSLTPVYSDVFGKVQYRLPNGDELAAHVLRASDRLTYLDDQSIRSRYVSTDAWLTWDTRTDARLRQRTVLSFGDHGWSRLGNELAGTVVQADVRDERTFNALGIRQDWTFDLRSNLLLKFGGEARRGTASYDYFSEVRRTSLDTSGTSPRMVTTWDTAAIERDPKGTRTSAYVSLRVQPIKPVTLEAGARYDHTTHVREGIASPRLNIAWEPDDATTIRASWGHYLQTQALYALQVQDGVSQFFDAERAEQRVVSIDRRLVWNLTARVEGYERLLTHVRPKFINVGTSIQTLPEVTWDRIRVAPTSGRARGIEAFIVREGGGRIDWSLGYAHAFVEDVIDGRAVPRAVDQRHTVHADWSLRSSRDKWRLAIAGFWHSGWPYTRALVRVDTIANTPQQFVILQSTVPGELNAERLPSYARVDARWTQFFDTKHGRLSLFAEVFNLLDVTNIRGYAPQFGLIGRDVFVGIAESHMVPRLPTIGFTWEFGGGHR